MVWVALVVVDGIQVTFGQTGGINLAGLIQLICNVVGLYHSYGNGVKQLAIGIPVGWVFGEDFFVALDVGSHGIATVVPHGLVVHALDAVYAQFIDHCL